MAKTVNPLQNPSYIVRGVACLSIAGCVAMLAGLAYLSAVAGFGFWQLPAYTLGGIGWLYFEYESRRLYGKLPFELGFTAAVEMEGRLPLTCRLAACLAPLMLLAKEAYPPAAYLLWPCALFASGFAIYLLLVCDLPPRAQWMAASIVAANLGSVALLGMPLTPAALGESVSRN
jgi:hypothetical protein